MKQLLVIFLFGFLTVEALGQQSVDVGIFGGAGTYFGDMTKINFQKSVNPAYGGFLRYNFNPRYALRFNVINGTIGAVGEFNSQTWNPGQIDNYWSFNKNVTDISLQFEFNYLKYIVGDKITPWSTYIFAGVGMQTFKYDITYIIGKEDGSETLKTDQRSGSEIKPTIPFGLGIKYNLSKRFGIGIEGGLRKSFSDKLDNLDDPLSYKNAAGVKIKFTDSMHNNDWTAYMGLHLVYKLLYGDKDWEIRTPRSRMIDWGIWNSDRKD